MKVALFGSTGFVGSYITDSLISNKYKPSVLVRSGSENKQVKSIHCNIVTGDIQNLDSIKKTIISCEAIIYNIGIIREFQRESITFESLHYEGLKRCVDAAKKSGINRFILMSANGVKEAGTGYQRTKYKAEEYLKKSGLDYTIFRPSLIFGPPKAESHMEFCSQLKKDMLALPIPAPLFHSGVLPFSAGSFQMSPIHVKNVADIFVKSLKMDKTINKTFDLGGSKKQTWKEIIKKIATSSRKNKWMIPAPAFGVKIVAYMFEQFKWFPITADQITMLMEGNTTEENCFKEFSIEEIKFDIDSLSYLA